MKRVLAVVAAFLLPALGLATPASAAPPLWDPLPPPAERNLHWTCGDPLYPEGTGGYWVEACVVVNDIGHAQAWAVVGNNSPDLWWAVDRASVNLHDVINGPVISHSACGELALNSGRVAGCANPTVAPSCGSNVYAKVAIWVNAVPKSPPPASRFVPC